MYRLALIGFGTVGQGFAELLVKKEKEFKKKYGLEARVTGIADTLKGSVLDPDGLDLKKVLAWTATGKSLNDFPAGVRGRDALSTIKQSKADIVLEATYTDIKTAEPAVSHIKAALGAGKHVITTNKGPLALHYAALKKLAAAKKAYLKYEGTVMAGSPAFNFMDYCLAGTEITEIKGILNGTTNYILTRMEEGLSYEEALRKAQELGYAEAVPDADVQGWDALAKVCILANAVFGAAIKPDPKKLPCTGITKITAAHIKKAKAEGKRYKLIGCVKREGKKVTVSVAPQALPLTDPLAGVMGGTNALTYVNDCLNAITVVGPGAGRKETGYAMLNDLLLVHFALIWR
jgi:homoserine dehydrogenase